MIRPLATWCVLLAALPFAAACATVPAGSFVWVDEFAPALTAVADGKIKVGDTLDIRVLGQEQLSTRAPVRSDGQITLPFLHDAPAAGLTPAALAADIERRLKGLLNVPVVTVAVEEAPPAPVSLLSEVGRPGKYPYQAGMTVLDALALAGGLTEYAHADRVFVLRGQPPVRIRFDTRRVLKGEGKGFSFRLEPGDTVVAE